MYPLIRRKDGNRMKVFLILFICACLIAPAFAQDKTALKTDNDKISYVLGLNLGTDMKKRSINDLNYDLLIKGIRDAYADGEKLMTDEEAEQVWSTFQQNMKASSMKMSDDNKKKGDEFLAQNKAKEGVVTLPSGLQYKVIKAGSGPKPKLTDTVTTHYRGTLINGSEFDSSYKRNAPVSFPVNGVIKGWTEALQLMETGSKWQLFIPSDLAYGPNGAGGVIGPNETLIFEVELISVKPTAEK
jgi:FKBP-type peptidyl-prolyl cis-trans isomerase